MKFTQSALAVLASASLALAANNSDIGTEDAMPSFLRTKSKAVTGFESEQLSNIVDKVPAEIGSLDPRARVELMGTLSEDFEKTLAELDETDLSDFPVLVKAVEQVKNAMEDVKKPLADSMHYMNNAIKYKELAAAEAEEEKAGALTIPTPVLQKQRRAQESTKQRVFEEEDSSNANSDNNSYYDGGEQDYGEQDPHHWRHYYNEHKRKAGGPKAHASSRHQHAENVQEAILNADHHFLNGMMDSMHARAPGAHTVHRNRDRRDLQQSKEKNCEQLATCAMRMSLYDLFAYYFSDDINPNTGEIDDSVHGFDEGDPGEDSKTGVQRKRKKIRSIGRTLLQSGGVFNYDSDKCDDLLQEFHRSIEVNGNPEWEGAYVAQVCAAEGTQVYVQLSEILLALAKQFRPIGMFDIINPMNPGAPMFADYIDDMVALIEPFATEVLGCAQDLFDVLKVRFGSNEPFPFAAVEGASLSGTVQNVLDEVLPGGSDSPLNDYGYPNGTNPEGRDEHGRLTDLSQRAFTVMPYGDIQASMNECVEILREEIEDDPEEGSDFYDCKSLEEDEAKFACFLEISKDKLVDCLALYADPIEAGISMVFGERASTGYVCGMRDAVVEDNKELPGRCCLNAPFQGVGDQWGYEYSCDDLSDCIDGPVFSGVSEAACRSYGGKFCPQPDCTELRDCVEDELAFADQNNLPMYKEYLSNSPQIGDEVKNQFKCGRAREYFGFQDSFIDDKAICGDIQQLRYSADFEFLNEFFGQGDSGGGGSGNSICTTEGDSSDDAVACVPTVGMAPPSRALSANPPVSEGQAWRATNFALEKGVDVNFFILELLDSIKCPCDPLCISDNICAAVKTIVGVKLTVLKFILEVAFGVSEFTYGEMAEVGNIEPIETWENTHAVFPNLDTMGDWLQARMAYLYFETTCRPVEKLLPGHGCDGQVNLCSQSDPDRVPDTCGEDAYPPEIDMTRVEELCNPGKYVFPTAEAGRKCVESHVKAYDDCYKTDVTVSLLEVASGPATCGGTRKIEVTAVESPDCFKSAKVTFDVLVDTNAPSYCKFDQDPSIAPELDISDAIDSCAEKKFFPTIGKALECIERHTKASDDCRNVGVTTTVSGQNPIVASCGTVIYDVDVTATIQGCSLSTTKSLKVIVDSGAEGPNCAFSQGPSLNPILDTSQAVDVCKDQIFPTIAAAEACVMDNTVTQDASGSCRPVGLTVATVNKNLCVHEVTITANVGGCNPLETVSDPIPVIIDNEPPVPTCSFGMASGVPVTGAGVLSDPQFSYTVTENCQTPLTVTVDGMSSERDQSQEMMVEYYRKPHATANNLNIGFYVASQICSSVSNGNCIADPDVPDTRFYKAIVKATDAAGLSAETECMFQIVDSNGGNGKKNDNNNSGVAAGHHPSQFFKLTAFEHVSYIPDNA